MTVSSEKGVLDGITDLIGLGLPCSQTDGGDFSASIKGIGLPVEGEGLIL
jgi:hypothetical protein